MIRYWIWSMILGGISGALAIGLTGCGQSGDQATQPINGQLILPKAGPGITLSGPLQADPSTGGPASSVAIKLNLPPEYVIQSQLQLDFDQDGVPEQVVAVKKTNDDSDTLTIVIAAKNPNTGDYEIASETKTLISNVKTFSATQQDLLGMHQSALVIRGNTKEFRQYLTALQPVKVGGRLQAKVLIAIDADTAIDIEATPRSAAYSESPDNATPFPINAMNKDQKSAQSLDLIKSVWVYDPAQAIYSQIRTEFIPVSQIQEAQLDVVYHGNKDDFEAFIQGAWSRDPSPDAPENSSTTKQIMFIDRDSRVIQLIEGDRLESNEWIDSFKGSYSNYLQAYMLNESFRSMRSSVSFGIIDANTIAVTVQDRPEWSGNFTKIGADQNSQLSLKARTTPPMNDIMLSGLYKDEKDQEILFTGQTFSLRSKGEEESGEYISFKLNEEILTFAYLNDQSIVQKTEHYIASLSEQKDHDRITRVLLLKPADLTIDGAQPKGSETRRYVQTSQ